ncbi:DJ-1/PfpI family protein [Alicyclobacillus fastidiosus]|uniref:DJ-1/PfpI family protein n=1 Tax=Alicyclobacillus fastidiosus TaxID=392011 RepID=A0ABV5ALE8_9BACL|nr:DJ-1/PfpI family protein [Alicyclobacillus fastidiosus]WEH08409.1 DJ-1/PfpI family protein [Alicyclobacillus fastidiosus]
MVVQIVLFDGFDLLDALAPYEVFVAASALAGGVMRVELVTADGERMVPSGITGLEIKASGKLDPTQAEIVLVPGAAGELVGNGPDSVPAILARTARTQLVPLIRLCLDQQGTIVATVCGGSLILSMAGLINQRRAVTNRLGMEVLAATGAVPVAARVVQDGNLVTGGGVTSGLDVALYIVEQKLGPQVAHAVEKLFEYERRGTIWRAEGIIPTNDLVESNSSIEESEVTNERGFVVASDQTPVLDGTWEVTISTPIGKQNVIFQISTKDGLIRGTATQGGDVIEFVNPLIRGNRLIWSQRVTKPMALNLKFEVTVTDNAMTGIAKARLLPPSKVEGTRLRARTNEDHI